MRRSARRLRSESSGQSFSGVVIRVSYVLQQLAKCCPGMVEIRSSRALRNPQHPTDLTVREPLDVVQHDHCPLPLAERRQRLLQTRAQLIRFAWIPKRKCDGVRQLVRVTYLPPPHKI